MSLVPRRANMHLQRRQVQFLTCLATILAAATAADGTRDPDSVSDVALALQVDMMIEELVAVSKATRAIRASNGVVPFTGVAWDSGDGVPAGTSQLGLKLSTAVVESLARREMKAPPDGLRTRGLAKTILKGAFKVVGSAANVALTLLDSNSGEVLAQAIRTLDLSTLAQQDIEELSPPNSGNVVTLARLVYGALGDETQPFAVSVSTERGSHAAYFEGDRINIVVEVEKDCFLRLYHISWSEKRLTMIFPNRVERDAHVRANGPMRFPGPGSGAVFEVARPFGVDAIIAIASETPFEDEDAVHSDLSSTSGSGLERSDSDSTKMEKDVDVEIHGDFLTQDGLSEAQTRNVITRGLIVREVETSTGHDAGKSNSNTLSLDDVPVAQGVGVARAVCFFTTLPRPSFAR